MSRWDENFSGHPFWVTFNNIKNVFHDSSFYSGENSQIMVEIARLHKVFSFIDDWLEQADHELVARATLDALNQHFSNIQAHINSFKNSENLSHLTNANDYADNAIIALRQIPSSINLIDKKSIAKSTLSMVKATEEQLLKINNLVDQNIENKTKELANLESQISGAQGELLKLNSLLSQVEQTIQKQTAEFNTQFQSSEKTRTDRFTQLEIKLETKFDEATSSLQNRADEEFKKLAIKAGTSIEILNKYITDAKNVFGVVVNTLQAGAYTSYANEEKSTANFFRWSAIILMLLAVSILVVPELIKIYSLKENYQLEWKLTLGRIPFSLILFVPAFYLARESGKHRNTEVVNRRKQLILSTADPYLELMDKDKAEEIKTEIAKNIFSEPSSNESSSSVSEASNVITQIVKVWLGK